MTSLVRKLPSTGPQVILFVIGEGPLRPALQNRIQDLEATDYIRLLGSVSDPAKLLPGVDILLLPSDMEGISLAVAEAMLHQIPIVTSNVGGLPEQLGQASGAGFLVPTTQTIQEQIAQYGRALLDLTLNSTLRQQMGDAAAVRVRNTFNQERTLEQLFVELRIALQNRGVHKGLPPSAAFGISRMIDEDPLADMRHFHTEFARVSCSAGHRAVVKLTRRSRHTWVRLVICLGSVETSNRRELAGSRRRFRAKSAKPPLNLLAMRSCRALPNNANRGVVSTFFRGIMMCVKLKARPVWDLRTPLAMGWRFNGSCFAEWGELDAGKSFFHLLGMVLAHLNNPDCKADLPLRPNYLIV